MWVTWDQLLLVPLPLSCRMGTIVFKHCLDALNEMKYKMLGMQ